MTADWLVCSRSLVMAGKAPAWGCVSANYAQVYFCRLASLSSILL